MCLKADDTPDAAYGRIYLITNTVNGKVYIGQTTRTIQKRWADHCSEAYQPHRKGYNAPIYRAIRKYSAEAFQVEELETCVDQSSLNLAEQRHIEERNATSSKIGYNARAGGRQGGSCTAETKYKIAASVKQHMQGPEARRRASDGARKQWADPEFRKKRSAQAKQEVADPARRKHLSELGKRYMEEHPEARTALRDFNRSEAGRKAKSESRKKYHAENPSEKTRLILASVTTQGVLSADIAQSLSRPNVWVTSGLIHCRDLGLISSRPLAREERLDVQGPARVAKVWFKCE